MSNFFNDKPKEEVKEPLFEIKPENESKPNLFAEIVSKDEEITPPAEVVAPSKPKIKMVEKLSGVQYNPVNILDLNNITQTYDDGKVTIFQDLNLNIKDIVDKGQFITILGQSGCGKSTILRYIAGLQEPTEGKIMLRGKELTENDRIPMVFQNYSSFPWYSVLDNVALPLIIKGVSKKESRERAMEMIKIVGLEGHEKKYAKYPNLSGGQLQRVAIARNLVANSEILLMDEPFGALDTVTRKSMQVFLRKIFQDNNKIDPTVILVTHDIREAVFVSTDIYIMDANPANVRCHIEVDLPDVRDIHIKRDPKFLEYVNYVEDFMDKLELENEAKKQEKKNEVQPTKKGMFSFLFKKQLKNKRMKKVLAVLSVLVLGFFLTSCDPVREQSGDLREKGVVVNLIYTPSKHEMHLGKTMMSMMSDYNNPLGGVDVNGDRGIVVGNINGETVQISESTVPEKYGVVFQCEHGRTFCIQGDNNEGDVSKYKILYDKLNGHVNDSVYITYQEIYDVTYEKNDDGKKVETKRVLVDLDFIDAQLMN